METRNVRMNQNIQTSTSNIQKKGRGMQQVNNGTGDLGSAKRIGIWIGVNVGLSILNLELLNSAHAHSAFFSPLVPPADLPRHGWPRRRLRVASSSYALGLRASSSQSCRRNHGILLSQPRPCYPREFCRSLPFQRQMDFS